MSTGNEGECSAGTISCRLTDGTEYYALSNNHVFALENEAAMGSAILQPGRYDTQCGTDPNNVIGALAAFVPIVFSVSASNAVDAAVATAALDAAGGPLVGKGTPSNGYGIPSSSIRTATVGLAVQKYGRTTSLTKGTVTAVNATINVGYGAGTARFGGQLVVQSRGAFLRAGDSGSLLVTSNQQKSPVGLLFAGNPSGTYAIANDIGAVLSSLSAQTGSTLTIDGQ